MKNITLLLSVLPLIVGCNPKPNISEVQKFVANNVAQCGGVVESVTLVREGIFSNKFVGFAQISIGGRDFSPDLIVYADTEIESLPIF